MLLAAAISELGLNLGPLISCNQDSLDQTNSVQVLFNCCNHFSSKIIFSCFTSSDKHFAFTTSENKTLPKVAISEEVEEMECWKPVHFHPALQRQCLHLTKQCQTQEQSVLSRNAAYQYLCGTEDDRQENTDVGESDSTVQVQEHCKQFILFTSLIKIIVVLSVSVKIMKPQ